METPNYDIIEGLIILLEAETLESWNWFVAQVKPE